MTFLWGASGWAGTLASFWVHFIVGGVVYNCGLLQMPIINLTGCTELHAAAIPSLLFGLTALSGVFTLFVTHYTTSRWPLLIGSMLSTLGWLLALLVKESYHLFLATTMLVGLGYGLSLTAAILAAKKSFNISSAFSTLGVYVGMWAVAPLLRHVIVRFQWTGVCALLIGLSASLSIGAIVTAENDTYNAFRPIKSPALYLLLLVNCLWSAGISAIFTFIPSLPDAAVMLSICGMSAACSRALFIVINKSVKLDYCSNALCTITLTAIVTGLPREMLAFNTGAIAYVVLLGLHMGYWSTLCSYVIEELIGLEFVCRCKGLVLVSVGLGMFIGPMGVAFVRQWNDIYCLHIAGACLLLSSIIMMVITVTKCYYRPVQDGSDNGSVKMRTVKFDENNLDTKDDKSLLS